MSMLFVRSPHTSVSARCGSRSQLITLLVLLVSDADILFTFTSFMSYYQKKSYVSIGMVGLFAILYLGGCIIAAREARLFVYRFREKVRLNEIAGLDLEDMDMFFSGQPITLPTQKSMQSLEQEFHDKAQGKVEHDSRAERAGHRTAQNRALSVGGLRANSQVDLLDGLAGSAGTSAGGLTEREADDEAEAAERGAVVVTRGAAPTVTLGKTVKESKRMYREDPERALYLLCVHKDITFAFFRERRTFSRR